MNKELLVYDDFKGELGEIEIEPDEWEVLKMNISSLIKGLLKKR